MRFLLLRHAAAAGQEPEAPLTELGRAQALAVGARLQELGVRALLSSPYRRAVETVQPFALRAGLSVHEDPRLVEYRLAGAPRSDWREALRQAFEAPERALEGGESVDAARDRALAALRDAMGRSAGELVICTHGALAAILLQASSGCTAWPLWETMSSPDLFAVDGATLRRVAI